MSADAPLPRLVREPAVLAMCGGITHPTLWAWRRRGVDPFPAPLRLSENVVAWRVEDVERWLSERPVEAGAEVSARARAAAGRSVAKRAAKRARSKRA